MYDNHSFNELLKLKNSLKKYESLLITPIFHSFIAEDFEKFSGIWGCAQLST